MHLRGILSEAMYIFKAKYTSFKTSKTEHKETKIEGKSGAGVL